MISECPYPAPTKETVCSMQGLLYYVHEREMIRLGRPTQDPVLRKYKFTNVRRRNDRVSRWVLRNIIEPNSYDDRLWFVLLIARLINWPPTLAALIKAGVLTQQPQDFDSKLFVRVVEDLKLTQPKIYSGAFMIFPGKQGYRNKSEFIANTILQGAIARAEDIARAVNRNRVQDVVAELSKCFGISTFMAGQVAADLTYAPGPLSEAADLLTYAPLGPGSQRGLNYLLQRKPFSGWTQREFSSMLQGIMHEINVCLGITGLTLHDVQSVCCEFSKYCRTILGEGKPKTVYQPETGF